MATAGNPKQARVDDVTVEWIATDDLLFDEMNPRLSEEPEAPPDGPDSQEEILRALWRDFAVDEVALSIAENGYFAHEPLFVAEEEPGLVVIEGNRRLAAVKLLRDADLRRLVGATDLPSISATAIRKLDELPTLVLARSDVWQYLGFKHVNGPQAWQSYSKAQYIAWVHNKLRVPLDEIARRIGDKHFTVERLYTALMALEQAERAGTFYADDRYKAHFSFSHLYVGMNYSGIQRFIGFNPTKRATRTPIPAAKIGAFGDLCEWLFGSKSKSKPALVQSQNPDLRILDEVLQQKDGIAALRQGLPLQVARDISKGDERLFREAIVAAKQALQEARGRILTGYDGEPDLLESAEDIVSLADSVYEEMRDIRAKRRRRPQGSKR
jgi:hypothetical protein